MPNSNRPSPPRPQPGRLPLNGLAVFEVAARRGSFSDAARDLGMTQSAVSHQIAGLEQELGVVLFDRVWRGVALTETGRHLYTAVARGFDTLGQAVDSARARGQRRQLTVVTDFGFAGFWLIPRLESLRAQVPDLELRIITTQAAGQGDVLDGDVAIVFGAERQPNCQITRLLDEDVVPVASRSFLDTHPIATIADLAAAPLLHLEAAGAGRWLSWTDYFAPSGVIPRPGLTLNTYPFVIQAALAGQGVALGWRPLIDDLVARDMLRPLDLPPLGSEMGYDFVVPLHRVGTPLVMAFLGWLLDQAEIGR